MLTKQDKKYLHKTFATKKDLERFATKKDLEQFATKKQLDQQALDIGTEFERIRDESAARARQVDKRFDMMEVRFDKMENLIKEVLFEVKRISAGLSVVVKRVDKIELHLGWAVA